MNTRPSYRYLVVTLNGAGIHGPVWHSLRLAKQHAIKCAEHDVALHGKVFLGPFEIERRLYDRSGSYRCWMRRRGRWVPYDHKQTIEDRQPDMRWPVEASA